MKSAFQSVLIITAFTLAGQIISFVIQIITASMFGASSDMDAFLAANTLPLYVISILLGSLGFVFIPFFVDYKARGLESKAYELATSLFNNCILILGVISILGIVFAEPLLKISAPGLKKDSLALGVKVAMISWPTVIGTGAFTLLTSVYQAEKKFSWQAAVPLFGAIINLILLLFLAKSLGVIGLAISTTCSIVLQVLFLLKIFSSKEKYNFALNWKSEDVQHIFKLVLPLILVAIVTKSTPLVDRYLASSLEEGSISHLNYAFKIAILLSALISTGGSTVIFPKMSLDASNKNLGELRNTMSQGLRMMWLIIAPIVTIGIPLCFPVVSVVLEHGEFKSSDTLVVSHILQLYLIALIAMSLGNISAKGFYVLKDTKTLSIFGTVEAIAYVIYTVYLTKWLGIFGIAIGYVIYFSLSLFWQVLLLNYKTGRKKCKIVIGSFSKTILAALLGGLLTYFATLYISNMILQILVGGFSGLFLYVIILQLLDSSELKNIWNIMFK